MHACKGIGVYTIIVTSHHHSSHGENGSRSLYILIRLEFIYASFKGVNRFCSNYIIG